MTLSIQLNGKMTEVSEETTLVSLLQALSLSNQRFAVEVNQTIVPRSAYKETILKSGDQVEIIHAIGGG